MNKIIYKLSILLVIAFTGCTKDFLEVAPVGQLSSDNFLRNDDEVKLATMGIYNKIQQNYSSGAWASVYFIKNLPADDVKCAGPNSGDTPEYQYLDDFNITSGNSRFATIWTNFYSTISSCNTIIVNVGAKTDATEAMKAMVGEAKALRAFTYLDLVIMFGGVPLMTVNPASPSEFSKPRATPAEIYAQIEADLKDAIAILPVKSAYSATDKFRFSKGTAQALLGKAYLYEEKYSEAATVLGNLIASNEYGLEPNYPDIWKKTHEFGTESIFEISYTSQENYGWGNFPWGGGNENNIEMQLEGPRADADGAFDFSGLNTNIVDISAGWGFNLPSKEIGDLLYSIPTDKRIAGSVLSEADYFAAGGKYQVGEYPYDYEGYIRLKYAGRASETTDPSVGQPELNYGSNYRIIRYADVLLMAAEAFNRSSTPNDAKAQDYLNQVRKRAFGNSDHNVTATGTALKQKIWDERRLELGMEGDRLFDLIRTGQAAAKISGFVVGKNEVFPIPQKERDISGISQNPNW